MQELNQTEVHQQTEANGNESVQRETVKTKQTVSGTVLAVRVVYYVGGTIFALLALRFVLLLLGASQASGFVDFIYNLSNVFVAPFNGIFTKPTYGSSTFDSATLVAIVVYSILIAGIAKLLTLGEKDRDVA